MGYSELNRDTGDELGLQDDGMMSVGEWLTLLEHLGVMRGEQVPLLYGRLAFMWSRIRSSREYSKSDRLTPESAHVEVKLRNLSLEDFLEAIIRISLLLSLPTGKLA